MRKLIIWDMMTLDGYFEGTSPWSLDFHSLVWGDEMEDYSLQQLDEVGTLLFGRRTFEGMAAYWSSETGAIANRMNAAEKVVSTRGGTTVNWSNARVLNGEITDHVVDLKAETGKKDIFVFGSAELTATLLDNEEVDEIRLCIVPTILGKGVPLFKEAAGRRDFKLIEARPFKSGGVLLRYDRAEA
jgi:dihydrofolate reductase